MTKFYRIIMWYACDICAHMEEIVWAIKWFLQIEFIFTISDECDRATSSRKAMGGVLPRNRAINARRRIAFRRKQTKWKKPESVVFVWCNAFVQRNTQCWHKNWKLKICLDKCRTKNILHMGLSVFIYYILCGENKFIAWSR